MFRGAAAAHEPSPPPPTEQRADPKRAWLDAIMSKARQSDVSPFASAASTPTMALAPQLAADRWPPRAEYAPLPPAGFRHAPPPAVVYQEQLAMDDRVLAEAMALAFDRMVAEQACSFIAKGMCHLCGTSERHLIPVANFCPDFHASHSLCREHLRSSHHLRIEDIFAGKGRPTVSKRALKCKVCSRECACSTCQLEKQHELSKYKRWLAGEHEFALDIRDRLAEPLARQQLGSGFGARPSGPGYATLDESQVGGVTHRPEPYPRRHEGGGAPQPPPGYNEPWRSEYARGEALELPPSMQASAKPLPHPHPQPRGAKRAAKNSSVLLVPPPVSLPGIGEPVESPSAAHVMNCAESEKSLVRLLTTLNQDVAPATAEPKDARFPPPLASGKSASARRQPSPSNPRRSAPKSAAKATERPAESAASSEAELDGSGSTSSSRNSKRKRAASARADSETSSEASDARGRRLSTQPEDAASRAPTEPSPQSESAPRPSPSASANASARKGKAMVADGRQRSTPKASPGGRKRRDASGGPALPPAPGKKAPGPRRDRKTASRRGSARPKDGRPARPSARGRADGEAEGSVDDASDADSEIDTNLDYCEVCFAAGDLVCCDVCPRSFHLACLKLSESDLPAGDWQCAECMKPSFFVRYLALVHMKQSVFGKCVEAIRCLKTHPFAKQFLTPVKNIGHYRSIVKHPMDLTTIETKLKTDKYAKAGAGAASGADKSVDIDAFANDVRLVWANCKLFNDDGSGITRAADELAVGFEDIYHHLHEYAVKHAAKSGGKASPQATALDHKSGADAASVAKDDSDASADAAAESGASGPKPSTPDANARSTPSVAESKRDV